MSHLTGAVSRSPVGGVRVCECEGGGGDWRYLGREGVSVLGGRSEL